MGHKIFFDTVKRLAKEQNKTIEEVVGNANLSLNQYNSYRRHGHLPRADEAVKIANCLGTYVEYLVTEKIPNHAEDKIKAEKDLYQRLDELEQIIIHQKKKFEYP